MLNVYLVLWFMAMSRYLMAPFMVFACCPQYPVQLCRTSMRHSDSHSPFVIARKQAGYWAAICRPNANNTAHRVLRDAVSRRHRCLQSV